MNRSLRVDFHTHIIAEEFPNLARKYNDIRFPILQNKCSCGADIYIANNQFRKITSQAWDPEKRIEDMIQENVDIQVLSPIPVTFVYWSSPEAGLELSKFQNDFIASVVSKHPDKFIGMGTVPLQDIDLAIKEMERATTELGLKGIEIGTNVNGLNLDDESLYPFFEAAAMMNVPIFVHPWATLGRERLTRYNSMYTIGMPGETALAAGSIILSGMLDKLPNLKLCFAHGAGSLPYILPRMDTGWNAWSHTRKTEYTPSYYAKKLYYDSLVYDPEHLSFMIDKVGVDRIMAGTDYPFPIREKPVGKAIEQLQGFSQEELNLMLGKNALTFLGVEN